MDWNLLGGLWIELQWGGGGGGGEFELTQVRDNCSTNILEGALQNCWGEFYILTQNKQPCKNSDIWSVTCYIMAFYFRKSKDTSSLFREKISACAAVHTRYVMDACDRVRPIILLPPMMGTSFVLVALTRLIVSKPKHQVTWSHRTCVNFPFLRGERIQYFSISA